MESHAVCVDRWPEAELDDEVQSIQLVAVQTTKSGFLHVYVQGNIEERLLDKTVILTVHDLGTNHKSFIRFVNHPAMTDVKGEVIFLHVCVPGQEDGASDFNNDYGLSQQFPTLDELGADLICVLNKLDVKKCIAFGEGAGANVICRFAMAWPNRVMGICLVHCTSITAGIVEYCKDAPKNLGLESGVMSQNAWDYLAIHKFGSGDKTEKHQQFFEEVKTTLNPKNLSKYLYSFIKRSDLSTVIGAKLDNIDALMVTGAKASQLHTIFITHKSMNKKKTTLLVIDNVSDVMAEAPEKLARSLIMLCKDCGVLSDVATPRMEEQSTLNSLEEETYRPRSVTEPMPPLVLE